MVRDSEAGRAADRLAAAAGTAADAGVRIGVEPMPCTACRTPAAAVALLEASGAPAAGVVVDVLHLYRSGGSAADLAAGARRAHAAGGLEHARELAALRGRGLLARRGGREGGLELRYSSQDGLEAHPSL